MSDGAFPDRLTQLKNRWEADPTSRIFLQLAEEYRHQGRVKEALGVLDRGLREHPGYLSALVAKGRCHLELGEPEPARTVLERVVKQDATQMVANKLLVRAYLDTGEPDKARERLDLYSLLTESDPETEELRRRLRAMEQPPQAPPTSDDSPLRSAAPPPRGRERGREEDLFDLGAPAPRPAARPEEPFADLFAPPPVTAPEAASEAAPEAAAVAVALEEAEPEDVLFPGLASRESRTRYLDALAAEGLFFLELAPAPPVPEPPPEPEWAAPPEPAPEPAPAAPAAAAPAEAAPVFDLEEQTPWAVEPEPVEPEPAEPIATVTLGELYLRQGHRDEAERIFHEVLRREPGNAAAQQAVERLAPPPPEPAPAASASAAGAAGRPLEARDLLAGYSPAAAPAGSAGAKARKVFLLNSYLQRLRRGGQRDVS